ncbi:TonB-dependent receptor [Metapseudomonas resinovorans]|uniref:Putative TonB-dependent siderophore receptor n=1 Tax=Metapseudomonas resinovorans NBRC 106553 TaxID=1245471 RepID=S6ALX3_METRE|nr:TonB-dependent receptor [Pseudomonas resinovorans]BAN49825.1 putative TonB-dependent siderophore receptor [Pseudomonas resinovorans NBRC 106553]
MSPRFNRLTARPLALAIGLALGTVSTLAGNLALAAEQQLPSFDIPAGPLASQLNLFAAQTGLYLAGNGALTAGKTSQPLHGSYSQDQALQILLGGSGLVAVPMGGGHYELQEAPEAGSALELTTLSISGKAPGSITEGTGSYTTYASSSSTRLNLTPRETPQAVTVLTRQRILDQRLTNLTDAMEATSGITVVRNGLGADSDSYWSRGFQINNFEVDGVPTSPRLDNYTQSTAIYDRIEVVRGATGLISGMGNPAATVNLIRKRPTFEPQVSLSAEAGSWDRYGTGVDVSGRLNDSGNVRGRLVLDYKDQKAWIDRFEQQTGLVYGITEFDLSEYTLLTLGFSYLKTNTDSPMRGGFPLYFSNGQKTNMSRSANTAPDWSFYDHEQSNVFASIEQQFDNGWSGKVEVGHTENEYDAVVTYLSGDIDQATGAGGVLMPTKWAGAPTQDNLDAYATGPFQLLGREHELITGVTLSRLREMDNPDYGGWLGSWSTPPYDGTIDSIFNWNGSANVPTFNKVGESSVKEDQYAAYLTTRLHLTDSTSLILGSRVVDWKRTNESLTYPDTRSKVKEKESGVTIPYAGVVQDLDENWAVYASYTKIFNPQGFWVRDADNGTLPPEEGTGYEVGLKGSFFEERLNSSLSLYKTEQENLAIWDGIAYASEESATSKGVELELNGELQEGWQIAAGYAYNVTEGADGDRIRTFVPRHSAKAFTTYRLPGDLDKLTVGGGFNWQSKYGDDLRYYTQDSYAVFNLMARYDISENLTATVNLDNLFDKEYFSSANTTGMYGAPRNVMTTLRYSY